jgi:secondary thiamine-phosphate synthase enzyme
MTIITIETKKKDEVIDITDKIQEKANASEENGFCSIFSLHTTCCLTTADLDPGTDLDLLYALRNVLPKKNYRHPHNPQHAPDHILSSVIGSSLLIPVQKGHLLLGVWQKVILIELDGPRKRSLVVSFFPHN